ncbi:MAG: hypothetical protein OEO20_04960 [Gemmatimonadota bacterium]|nr:hypothetical protein [Gemmatimonadota bacterium]MDH3366376.1 hypothetical protein [Gemmatimonadota bacterium]MDH3477634.1 hypothetical protein [Gemmatimonadota bacterium]MDH3568549.1 hypothetical protein [Gemmatimonadota bacterium]MDH5549915.1 hypothetical protein [Gemmatimonadota bacterium]
MSVGGSGFRIITAVALLAASPVPGQAQVQVMVPTGQLGAEFRGAASRVPGSSATQLGTVWEWVDLSLTGALKHPRVFLFRAHVRPTWLQGYSEVLGASESDATQYVNYDLHAALFSGLPVSLSGRARRLVGSDLDVLSAARDYDLGELGARLDIRYAPLPMYVDLRNETRVESWVRDGSEFALRDESLRTLEFRARNRKFSADLQRRDFTDRTDGRDFESFQSTLQHRARWGKRSTLSSYLVYLDRTGFMPHQRLAWAEQLHLQHSWSFATDLRYGQSWDENSATQQRGRNAQAVFTYTPSQWLRATADGSARWNRYTNGTRDEYRVMPMVALTARLPATAVLRLHGSVGYESVRQTATDGSVPVINELHVIDASGRFTLAERFADPSTVTVTDAAETIVYQPDLDYRLVEGGPLLEVLVLPQGRIAAGDTVLVDYLFRISPDARSEGAVVSYGAGVEVRGFRVYFRHDIRDLDEKGPFFLGLAQNFITAGVGYTASLGVVQADVRGEYQRQRYDGLEASTYLVNASLAADVHRAFRATVSASGYQKRGALLPYDNVQGHVSLVWTPIGALRLGARAALWWWEEGDVRSESFNGIGLDADVRLRLLTLRVAYDRGWWDDGRDRTTDRLVVRFTRDF